MMASLATVLPSLVLIALATSGTALGVAALFAWFSRPAVAGIDARRVRDGQCATLRRYGRWWMMAACAWAIVVWTIGLAPFN